MELLGDVDQVEGRFDLLGDGVNLGVDRCTVCTECTMGIKIVLGAPDGTPR
jgi:hypothetical protein